MIYDSIGPQGELTWRSADTGEEVSVHLERLMSAQPVDQGAPTYLDRPVAEAEEP